MYNIVLKEEDMLQEDHFPVIALINEACNANLLEFIRNLCEEVGSGYNFTNCTFWSELDDYDKTSIPKYDGLFVETEDGEKVTISLEIMQKYLKLAVNRIIPTTDREELYSLIESLGKNA
jgi:hypothetical protein